MSSYADLQRPPLVLSALQRSLSHPWTQVRLLAETSSTNTVAVQAAAEGAPAGLVVIAEHQSAGRGRLDRSWEQPPRAGIAMSVLVRPGGSPSEWGWLPLTVGLAVCAAVDEVGGLKASVKWPNDVLLRGEDGIERKLAGVLAEVVGDALVIGIGLNCTTRSEELPPGATSLAVAQAETVDRIVVLRALLRALGGAIELWSTDRDALREAYLQRSATVGRTVSVMLPGGRTRTGRAQGVDDRGCLMVDGEPHAAGDVVHVR